MNENLEDRAVAALAGEAESGGRGAQFAALKPWLLGELPALCQPSRSPWVSAGRVRHRLVNHGVPVTAIAISPDSELLWVGGRDGTVRLWRIDGGRELRSFRAHQREISSLGWGRPTLTGLGVRP